MISSTGCLGRPVPVSRRIGLMPVSGSLATMQAGDVVRRLVTLTQEPDAPPKPPEDAPEPPEGAAEPPQDVAESAQDVAEPPQDAAEPPPPSVDG